MTIRPIRLRLSRAKGFNLQAHSHVINGLPAISCARPSKWGNPFRVKTKGSAPWFVCKDTEGRIEFLSPSFRTRSEAINKAVELFDREVSLALQNPMLSLKRLHGHNLACWCGLDEPCHVDVWLRYAREYGK